MRVYGSTAIRNVAFVGHGGSGKTTLVDALAFVSGSSRRHGTIKEGTTLTDHSPDEIERQHSISLGLGFAEWMDTKLNLIDAPGYLDFFGEAVTALHAADAAVVVLNGTSGVEVGTEKVWEVCDQRHLPRILFVSQMDKDHANFERVFDDVKDAPVAQGPSGRDPGRRRPRSSRASSTSSPARPTSTRRAPRPASTTKWRAARVPGAVRQVRRAADRGRRVDRRRPDRALPRRRGDPPRRGARGDEEGGASGSDRAALLRQRAS